MYKVEPSVYVIVFSHSHFRPFLPQFSFAAVLLLMIGWLLEGINIGFVLTIAPVCTMKVIVKH